MFDLHVPDTFEMTMMWRMFVTVRGGAGVRTCGAYAVVRVVLAGGILRTVIVISQVIHDAEDTRGLFVRSVLAFAGRVWTSPPNAGHRRIDPAPIDAMMTRGSTPPSHRQVPSPISTTSQLRCAPRGQHQAPTDAPLCALSWTINTLSAYFFARFDAAKSMTGLTIEQAPR